MPLNSTGPSCASAIMPNELAGIAAVMKRDGGVRNVTFPTSTRRRISSSSPWYQTLMLLLTLNSRSLSKSTLTKNRWLTMPPASTRNCSSRAGVGKPPLHPEAGLPTSAAVQLALRNLSNLISRRTFSSSPRSAYRPSAANVRPPSGCATSPGSGIAMRRRPVVSAGCSGTRSRPARNPALKRSRRACSICLRVSRSHLSATSPGVVLSPSHPPGSSAPWLRNVRVSRLRRRLTRGAGAPSCWARPGVAATIRPARTSATRRQDTFDPGEGKPCGRRGWSI